MGEKVMNPLNFILLGLIIIILLYSYKIRMKIKTTLERIDNMLDLAIKGELVEESFDETMFSKIESKFNRYLLGLSSSEVNTRIQKDNIQSLIADISHQTKTPIANISLYSELLIEDQSREYIDQIRNQTEKLNFLIQNLVKASRLETGIIKLNSSVNDLNTLIENVIRSVENKAKTKNIEVIFQVEERYFACFDPKWTEEAIYNIVDNSIKYSREHNQVIINMIAYQMFIRVDIIDNGIGIEEEDMPKIFQRFYRGEKVASIDGVGIGLYLTREIIQGESGYIKVTSEVNKGSTFSIFLPRDKR